MSGRTTNIGNYVQGRGIYANRAPPPNAHLYPPQHREITRDHASHPSQQPEPSRDHAFLLTVAYSAKQDVFYASHKGGIVYNGKPIDELAGALERSQQIPAQFSAVPGYVSSKKSRGRGTARIKDAEPARRDDSEILEKKVQECRAKIIEENQRSAEETIHMYEFVHRRVSAERIRESAAQEPPKHSTFHAPWWME